MAAEYPVIRVNPKSVKLVDKNARVMPRDTYLRLVQNIRTDDGLTSVPLVRIMPDGAMVAISGNHRIMAAIDAELDEIAVMTCIVSDEKARAMQLSHNSISGIDDPMILLQLVGEIKDPEMLDYSNIDSKLSEEVKPMDGESLSLLTQKHVEMTFIFVEENAKRIEQSIDHAMKSHPSADMSYLAGRETFEKVLDTIQAAKADLNVRNADLALLHIMDTYLATRVDKTPKKVVK